MTQPIWDFNDGDMAFPISDNMAIDSDGDLSMRISDNMAIDIDSGELHFTSSWRSYNNNGNDDDDDDD